MEKYRPCVFIDFDKTISPVHGFHVPPWIEVIESINLLKEKYKIIIFSCRANADVCPVVDLDSMMDYLHQHGVYYDEIYHNKPLFYAVIDDRSFNSQTQSWADITTELMNRTT